MKITQRIWVSGPMIGIGATAIVCRADISKRSEVDAMFNHIESCLGPVAVLVNNAGIQILGSAWADQEAAWDEVIGTNLIGPMFCMQSAFAKMEPRKKGAIINITSIHDELPKPRFSSYAASKAGLRSLTTTLALELAPFHIRVNAVAPGVIMTPLNTQLGAPEVASQVAAMVPLGRLGTPDDVAQAISYLASERASYITGAVLHVDGGYRWAKKSSHGPLVQFDHALVGTNSEEHT